MLANITLYILLASCLLAMLLGILDAVQDRRALPKERLNAPWGLVARQGVRRAILKMLAAVVLCGAILWSETKDDTAVSVGELQGILDTRNMAAAVVVLLLTVNAALEWLHRRNLRRRVASEHFPRQALAEARRDGWPPPKEMQL